MIENKRVLCLIPAKGRSTGLIGKNAKPLFGKPLVAWPITTALNSRFIDKVIVSTDSETITRIATGYYVETIKRPAELAQDESSTLSVIEHALEDLAERGEEFEYLVLLEATSPLTEPHDVDSALLYLHGNRTLADAVVSVAKVTTSHPDFCAERHVNGLLYPLETKRRQDVSDLYYPDGSFYISSITELLQQQSFYHERTLSVVMPKYKTLEIDDLVDLACIEGILVRLEDLKPLMHNIY